MALKDWKKVNTNNWFYLKENKAVIVKTETIYFPEIKEIYVLNRWGTEHMSLALNHMESTVIYSSNKPNVKMLREFIRLNSINGTYSCMDLGTVIMQWMINGK